MKTALRLLTPPAPCEFLKDKTSQLEYELVTQLTPEEWDWRLDQGWRRSGMVLFRPRCPSCTACQAVRILVDRFQPTRSQRRVQQACTGVVRREIGRPHVTPEKLRLYDAFHSYRAATRGWRDHAPDDPIAYLRAFVANPIGTQEWCYYMGNQLVAVGYVDVLPELLSAIYFFYDPEQRALGLGVFNILSIVEEAVRLQLPYVHLGYYVEGCQSLSYKGAFRPSDIMVAPGKWEGFRK